VFGRKSKPEETPEKNGAEEAAPVEEQRASKPAPASSGSGSDGKKVNLAAKRALLKAYYASAGYSPEQIQKELARIAGEEGEAATIPGAPPAPAAGSIADLESQVREIGKLAGDTILKMEEQISGLLNAGAAGLDDSRLDNLQEQINTIYENQQTAYQSLTELTGNVGMLTEEVGKLRVQAESAPDAPATAQDFGLEERLTAITEGLAKRISALEKAEPPEAAPQQDSGLEERITAITGGMGERISGIEERLRDLQAKLDELSSKETAPAEGAPAGELARKMEGLAAKMAADGEVVEKMQEKIDEIRRKEGKTLSEIERHVADQLRVTMKGINENMEKLRSETSVPQIKEELEKKIGTLEEFQEGTLPALEEVKTSAANIKAGLIAAIDECLSSLDGDQAVNQ